MDCGEDIDDEFEGIYQNGHWEWNEISGELVFISDSTISEEDFGTPLPTVYGSIEFNDEIDLLEQQTFSKRYQRMPKTSEDDIVTLQDVKDVVIFSAPVRMLSPAVISVLHLPITERFIRALIFYCQYYLQISDEMCRRILELKIKVRNIRSSEMELAFRENLEDLRLLVAKEYCSMITGVAEFKNYHHMGPSKKTQSLTKKELILFESIFKPRLRYMERVLVAPEHLLVKLGISLGILGLPRSQFDTMLKEIKGGTTTGSIQLSGGRSTTSRSSRTSATRKSFPNYTRLTLYADIILPEKEFET